ncbi:MAG: hypothetical protein JRD05_10640 [Deltaproteobacteria bacterium]|nr:hypothetical protein [Deltaproteobacteria bacterium]
MEHSGFITYIVSWLGVITGIFTLFEKASDSLKEESRVAISQWLMNVGMQGGQPKWPTLFAATFDSVFTKRHLSWSCFWRSSLASVFAVILIALLLNSLGIVTDIYETISEEGIGAVLFALLFCCIVFNIIPDYISLLETRIVINWMSKKNTFLHILVLLLLDIVATNIIFFVITFMLLSLLTLLPGFDLVMTIKKGLNMYIQGLTLSGKDKNMGIFIYSTFFTSIWVWLYAFSGLCVGIVNKSKSVLEFFKKHLAIEDRPLRSMGFVIVLIITFGYLVGGLFLLQK